MGCCCSSWGVMSMFFTVFRFSKSLFHSQQVPPHAPYPPFHLNHNVPCESHFCSSCRCQECGGTSRLFLLFKKPNVITMLEFVGYIWVGDMFKCMCCYKSKFAVCSLNDIKICNNNCSLPTYKILKKNNHLENNLLKMGEKEDHHGVTSSVWMETEIEPRACFHSLNRS